MKILSFFSVFLCFTLNLNAQEISFPEQQQMVSSFELTIEGISEDKGEIRIALFNSERDYKEKENPLEAIVLSVDDLSMTWRYEDLPYGEYAIAVYHDKNENGKLDSNILGIPKEAYGFSNNARGRFGPASWKDAHFKVSSTESSMSISIK